MEFRDGQRIISDDVCTVISIDIIRAARAQIDQPLAGGVNRIGARAAGYLHFVVVGFTDDCRATGIGSDFLRAGRALIDRGDGNLIEFDQMIAIAELDENFTVGVGEVDDGCEEVSSEGDASTVVSSSPDSPIARSSSESVSS